MFQPAELIICLVVPAVASLSVACILNKFLPGRWFEVAVALGYVAGHLALAAYGEWNIAAAVRPDDMPAWTDSLMSAVVHLGSPHVARDWLPFALTLTVILKVVLQEPAESRTQRWVTQLIWLAMNLLLVSRLLWGSSYTEQEWTGTGTAWRIGGLGVALWLPGQVASMELIKPERVKLIGLVALFVTATAIGMTLLLSGSKTYGLHSWIVASAIAGTAIREMVSKRSGASVPRILPMLLGSLIILGLFFAELPGIHASLLFAAVVLSTIQLRPPVLLDTPRQHLICGGLAIGLSIATVAWAANQFAKDIQAAPSNPYEQYSESR